MDDNPQSPTTPTEVDSADKGRSPRKWDMRLRILRRTSVLPACFTLLNGLAGFGAIHFATKHDLGAPLNLTTGAGALFNLKIAALLLIGAMIWDMLDGRLARMTRTTSDFGAQLDSLCDIISFGLAPAILMLRASASILRSQTGQYLPIERIIWCIAGVYVTCTALRLARFNVETDRDELAHMDFRGLPSPGAAAGVATMVLLFVHLMKKSQEWPWLSAGGLQLTMSVLLPILTLASALLMVSRFRYPHMVNHYIRVRRPFSYLVKLVLLILAAVLEPYVTFAAAALIYILSGPVRAVWVRLRYTHPAR